MINILPINIHLSHLSEAVFSIEGHCEEFFDSMKLLKYAGNIEGINYDPFSLEGSFCKGVNEYELQEQETLQEYLTNFSIFTVTWMGLESLINEMQIVPKKSTGKIYHLCKRMNLYSKKIKIPLGYKKYLNQWIKIEKELNNKYKSKNNLSEHINLINEGIYRVYGLRNHIFHGDFSLILPNDPLWNKYNKALKLGTRIIAYTIQMLLMGYFSNRKFVSTYWHSSLEGYHETVSIGRAFRLLHISWL